MREPTAEASVLIDASPAVVWNALTDPALIREYFMGATVSTDWTVGSPITFAGEWNGNPYEDKGEILAFQPEEEVCFSHWSPMSGSEDVPENYHVVDITLQREGKGTKVTLTQSNLEGGVTDADRANRDDYENNWASTLDGLKKVAES